MSKTIVDIGATGFLTNNWEYQKNDVAYLFEPHPDFYKDLQKQLKDIPNIHLFDLALSNKTGYTNFYTTQKRNCSSLLEPNSANPSVAGRSDILTYNKITVKCDTLDNVLKDVQLIDYMKLDTQGSEYEIILGGEQTLKRTKYIKCEVEFSEAYKNQKLYEDVKSLLAKFGFKETDLHIVSDWHGDAYFKNTKI